ncbi:GlxA family transcriptional regulator [Amycolatopsis sp. cmx-4-61]|uniref:GlxA family transcriptional regulator n=1 Tax=Amycolatopsis sp. cmx-4-61 TaxID=2790937 RepID=UPI00397E25BF
MRRVAVLVYDGVTLLDVAGPIDVFREADAGGGENGRYEVSTVTPGGGAVTTSSGVRLWADPLDFDQAYDTVLVAGADGVPASGDVVEALARLRPRVRRLASVCTGAFLLAEAGLLDDRRATTHWQYVDRLRRRYPAVQVEPDAIFVRAGSVFTSAGVSAGIDLALALVEDDHGADLAREVARSLVVFLRRPGGQSQFSVRVETRVATASPLKAVLDAVVDDITADHTTTSMAATANVSNRQLNRLFREQLGTTPRAYVEAARLEAAQTSLLDGRSVTATALACGFGSDETMRRAFVRHLGVTPTVYVARFRSVAG